MVEDTRTAALRAKIRALLARTTNRGCTEAEALAAAAKAAELLDRYGWAMADVEEREELRQGEYKPRAADLGPVRWCLVAIASYCDVEVWRWRSAGRRSARFYGADSDVAMAEYLTDLFARSMASAARTWAADHRRRGVPVSTRMRSSFLFGMAHRLRDRLAAMKRERNATVDAGSGRTGHELVVGKMAAVKAGFAALSLDLKQARGTKMSINSDAFFAGSVAGNSVNITRPVGAGAVLRIA